MQYDMRHIGSVPETRDRPAFCGDVACYITAIADVAAREGAAAAPPGARAQLCVRPEGGGAWLYCGPVAGLTRQDIENAFDACVCDADGGCMEVDVKWLTDAENDALPEFDGW